MENKVFIRLTSDNMERIIVNTWSMTYKVSQKSFTKTEIENVIAAMYHMKSGFADLHNPNYFKHTALNAGLSVLNNCSVQINRLKLLSELFRLCCDYCNTSKSFVLIDCKNYEVHSREELQFNDVRTA